MSDHQTVLSLWHYKVVDINTSDWYFGFNALFYATMAQDVELIRILRQHGSMSINDTSNVLKETPFLHAAKFKSAECLEALLFPSKEVLLGGANVNYITSSGHTVLEDVVQALSTNQLVCDEEMLRKVELLLEAGTHSVAVSKAITMTPTNPSLQPLAELMERHLLSQEESAHRTLAR